MLTERLEQLFTPRRLIEALERYRKEPEAAQVEEAIRSGAFLSTLQRGYVPEPMRGFEIPKSNGEMRQIATATTASKVIQRVLADALVDAVTLNDKSYAFRPGKGPLRAAGRARDFLHRRGYTHVARADVDDFFDTINQEKLIAILEKIIVDRRIVVLISLFLKNGLLKHHKWIDKSAGIYQGDVLSPVLANLYLHTFDTTLEEAGIDFVRFADDMVMFGHSMDEVERHMAYATRVLEALDLRFGEDKGYRTSVVKGFEFLGLRFRGEEILMDNDRLMRKLSTLSKKTKKMDLAASIDFFNTSIAALRRYYLKILSSMGQLALIEEHIDTILIHKIAYAKQHKIINNKSRFVSLLMELESCEPSTPRERKEHAHTLIARAYESIALNHPLETAAKRVQKKKVDTLQSQIKSSELILNRYGLYVSLSRGKVVVKEYGKVTRKLPVNWLTRILVMTPGASLSTALIYECARRRIDIDFIEKNTPVAQILYYTTVSHELHQKQMALRDSPKRLAIARVLVRAKIKNQINLIKYHYRYRTENKRKGTKKLQKYIARMEDYYKQANHAAALAKLMGYEGGAAVVYWRAFGMLIGQEDFTRQTQNAPDAINQALNYGYAFLYHRMQSALVRSGLDLYQPFLHAPQPNKPTLVYDMIEPLRQPVVDREIISILNRGTELHTDKGRLTKPSVKVVTENIQERLATPTRWRKGKYAITTIIDEQALELAHVIQGIKSRFKPFVVRY